jgi:hypothetical protein
MENEKKSRESFIIYKSFIEAGKKIKNKNSRLLFFEAIFDFALRGKLPTLTGIEDAMFTLVLPQLEANNKRFENGARGGKPITKPEPNPNQNVTKSEPNENVNVLNENVNVLNENVNVLNENVNVLNENVNALTAEHAHSFEKFKNNVLEKKEIDFTFEIESLNNLSFFDNSSDEKYNQCCVLFLKIENEKRKKRYEFKPNNIKSPTIEDVKLAFDQSFGTEEMAIKFYTTNEGTGWNHKGSKMIKWQNFVKGYIESWKQNEFKNNRKNETLAGVKLESYKNFAG